MSKRFKVEFVDLPNADPFWFDTQKEVDDWVRFLKDCPVDDGPTRVRVTEFSVTKTVVI